MLAATSGIGLALHTFGSMRAMMHAPAHVEPHHESPMKRYNSAFATVFASGSIVLAALLFCTGSAHAHERERRGGKFMLALDLDYATAFSNDLISDGGGFGLRIGSEYDMFLISLIPELVLDYHNFASDTPDRANITTGKIGGRIRFFKIVEPGVFAHIGIGNISGNDRYSHTSGAFDWGFTLDLTILPLVDLGLHASWNRVFGGYDTGSYGLTGLHVALVF